MIKRETHKPQSTNNHKESEISYHEYHYHVQACNGTGESITVDETPDSCCQVTSYSMDKSGSCCQMSSYSVEN